MRPARGVDEPARAGRDARQPLQEIERGALADQQRARGAEDLGDLLAGAARYRRRALPRHAAHRRLDLPERLERDVEPGEHAVGFHRNTPRAISAGATVASVVMSPSPTSSSSARRTMSR